MGEGADGANEKAEVRSVAEPPRDPSDASAESRSSLRRVGRRGVARVRRMDFHVEPLSQVLDTTRQAFQDARRSLPLRHRMVTMAASTVMTDAAWLEPALTYYQQQLGWTFVSSVVTDDGTLMVFTGDGS